jgi:hypothetical protein
MMAQPHHEAAENGGQLVPAEAIPVVNTAEPVGK